MQRCGAMYTSSRSAVYDDDGMLWLLYCSCSCSCSIALILTFAAWFHRDKLVQLLSLKKRRPPLPPSPPGLPIIGHLHLIGPVPHRSLHMLAQKYGPIFLIRLGYRPTLVISSPALAKDFLYHHDHSFAHRPRSLFAHLVFHGCQGSVFMEQTPRWKALRRLYAQHVLSAKSVAASKKVRDEEMSTLLQKLRSIKAGARVEIRASVFDWMLNVTARVLFSERVQGGQMEDFPAVFKVLSELFPQPLVADFVPALRRFVDPGGLEKQLVREAARMDAIMESIVRKRLVQASAGSAPSDVLTTLLQFEGKIPVADGSSLCVTAPPNNELAHSDSNGAVKACLLELLTATTDTTTAVVEWAMAELLCQRDTVLQRLKEELDAVVGGGVQQVEEEHLGGLPYLEAVVKEALRLHPPASTLLPHFSKEATQVAGYSVPENTILVVNAWAIGRDESLWEEAHVYKPERFLGGGSDSHISWGGQNNYQLLAFGKGRRGCPGRSLGLLMASLVVANLVHCFEWETPLLPDLQEKMSAANVLAHPLEPILVSARRPCC